MCAARLIDCDWFFDLACVGSAATDPALFVLLWIIYHISLIKSIAILNFFEFNFVCFFERKYTI